MSGQYKVAWLCEALLVSRSGYYDWKRGNPNLTPIFTHAAAYAREWRRRKREATTSRPLKVKVRSIIFGVGIASLSLHSQLGLLDQPLFGKVLLLSPSPSARPAHFRTPPRDYSARQRILDQPLFGKVLLLSLGPSARPAPFA